MQVWETDCEVDRKLNTFGGYASVAHGIDWIRQAKQNYSVDSDLPQFLPESLNREQRIAYDRNMLTWNENSNQLLMVVAGTAGSAHNVGGSTIHGMLQMSVGATDEDDMSLGRSSWLELIAGYQQHFRTELEGRSGVFILSLWGTLFSYPSHGYSSLQSGSPCRHSPGKSRNPPVAGQRSFPL